VDQDAAYLSPTEVRRALDRLGRADIVRLSLLAKNWVRGLPRRSADDLVNEAFERILSGKRPWPSDVDRGSFFNGVMRSISSQWRKEDYRELLAEDQEGGTGESCTIEPDHDLNDLVFKMRQALGEDEKAKDMFEHMLVDRDREEVQSAIGVDATGFDTVRRRMFRHLREAFSSGWTT
jgi:DNA-directed RNA polymerase specialized sigma24 family protein